jgi:hypothetical protein
VRKGGNLEESQNGDEMGVKSTSRKEIVCTNVTKTTIRITEIMERDNSGSMRRDRLGENPRSIA